MKDFCSKCDQIRSFLRIWSHLLKNSLMENFIFSLVLMASELRVRERELCKYRNPSITVNKLVLDTLFYFKGAICLMKLYFLWKT